MITIADIVTPTIDANALARQINANKIAYINGQKIIGQRRSIWIGGNFAAPYSCRRYDSEDLSLIRGSYSNISFGAPSSLVRIGNYVYIKYSTAPCYRVNLYDMQYVDTVNGSGYDNRNAAATDNTNILFAGSTLEKYTIFAYSSNYLSYGGTIYGMCILGSYAYIGGATTNKVFKITISSLTKSLESADYGGTIFAVATNGVDIFAGGMNTNKIFRYSASDLSKISESTSYGGTIRCIYADNIYVYAAGNTTQKVYKYRISDMSKVAESIDYGGTIRAIAGDDACIYIAGETTQKIYMLSKIDLSKIDESPAQGADIQALII